MYRFFRKIVLFCACLCLAAARAAPLTTTAEPDEEETSSTTRTTTAGLEEDSLVPTFQCSTLSHEEYRASVSSLYTGFIIASRYITHVSRLVIN